METYTDVALLPSSITVAEYLFHRLKQMDIRTIFGLPGEFNMPLIDKLYKIPSLRWAGNANELNAAYAADGYARLKRLGCLITTFGVGELSALNGIAGSFSEHLGILHVVRMPPLRLNHSIVLILFRNGDYKFPMKARDILVTPRISHRNLWDEMIKPNQAWISSAGILAYRYWRGSKIPKGKGAD
ncbi:hypothetical protein Kpol_1046p9, partial [Vanderwaltozyma polyspora DSM 70294]